MPHARSVALVLALVPLVPRAPAGDELRLGKALETIEASEIRSDLFFFASQEMRGRDTPSEEQRVAARFVAARLERLGLRPGAGASWFYEYPVLERRIDPARTRLTIAGSGGELALAFARDYYFLSSSDVTVLDLEGGGVWCGEGERAEFERATSVRGRFALCRASDLSARRRARYAEAAGALGMIVLPDPTGSADPGAEICARTTEYALRGLVSREKQRGAKKDDEKKDDDEQDAPFPQVHLSLATARRLAEVAGWHALPAVGEEVAVKIHDVRAGTGPIALENVCALWPGSDPALSKEVLIVSAHYDHEGVKNGKVFPGADDNGSGSMGLLALAEALTEYGPMRRTVLLMWMSGEEKGLWGSYAWTKAPLLPDGHRAVLDLNIDMIGRNAPDTLLITPTKALKEYNGLTRLAEQLAPLEGFPKLGSADKYWKRSDHMNFAENLRIPVAFLFSDVHEDYHQPTDTPDKIDYEKIRRVTRLVLRMLDELQTDALAL